MAKEDEQLRINKMDYWVRQFLGNTGKVSYEEASAALAEIERNLTVGLFPTTGGAVSLLSKEDVDELYRSNRGLFPKFRPIIPDAGGLRAKTLSEWYVAAIEQAIMYLRDPRTLQNLHSPSAIMQGVRPFALRHTTSMDSMLHTYHSSGVDWRRIHSHTATLYGTAPIFGKAPYWLTHTPEPLSVLAFTDEPTRSFAQRQHWG